MANKTNITFEMIGKNEKLLSALNDTNKKFANFKKKIGFSKEAAMLAASMQGVTQAFKRFDNSEKVLQNLRKATRGTVSDLQLMQNSIKADNFKIPLDVLAKGLEFATKRAAQTGESVEYLVDSFTTGLGRQSVMILDNLGISATELSAEVKKTGDFMTAVGNITDRELVKMGDVILTDAQKMAQFSASIANAQTNFGNLVLNGFAPFIDLGNRVFTTINKQSTALTREKDELNLLVKSITETNISETARLQTIREIQAEYPDFLGNLDAEKITNEDLVVALRNVNAAYKERIKLAVVDEDKIELERLYQKEIRKERDLSKDLIALREKYGDITMRDITNATAQEKQLNQVKFAGFTTALSGLGKSKKAQKELLIELANVTEEYDKMKKKVEALEAVSGSEASSIEKLQSLTAIGNKITELEEKRTTASVEEIKDIDAEIAKLVEKRDVLGASPKTDSIEAIETRIKALMDLREIASKLEIQAIDNEIVALNEKKKVLNAEPKLGALEQIEQQVAELTKQRAVASEAEIGAINDEIKALGAKRKALMDASARLPAPSEIKSITGAPLIAVQPEDVPIPMPDFDWLPTYTEQVIAAIEQNEIFRESAYLLGDVFNFMGDAIGTVNSAFGDWIKYAGDIIGAAGKMISVIKDVVAAKRLEVLANEASAISGAITSGSAYPFPLNILAIAASVAAVVAALASVPKFATGGIVPGNSFIGDKVPALVNSGEMILTRQQQQNMFSMINRGGNEKLTGTLVADGDQLIAVIEETNKRNEYIG